MSRLAGFNYAQVIPRLCEARKKRMKKLGKVELPQGASLSILQIRE